MTESLIGVRRGKRGERREEGQQLGFAGFGGADKAAHQLPGADCFLAEFDGIHCQLRIVVLNHAGQGADLLLCQVPGFSPAIKIFKCHRLLPSGLCVMLPLSALLSPLFPLHSPLFALPAYGTHGPWGKGPPECKVDKAAI